MTNADPAPEEIEDEIERTRSEMTETLLAIEQKLSPRQLMEHAMETVRDATSGQSSRMTELIRDNPVPAALLGLGVGWMLISSLRGQRAQSSEDMAGRETYGYGEDYGAETYTGLGESGTNYGQSGYGSSTAYGSTEYAGYGATTGAAAGRPYGGGYSGSAYPAGQGGGLNPSGDGARSGRDMGGTMRSAAEKVKDTARDAASRVGDAMSRVGQRVGDTVRDTAESVRGRAGEMTSGGMSGGTMSSVRNRAGRMARNTGDIYQQHPLTMGLVAIIAGAALGAALPISRRENEMMGPARDDMMRSAREMGSEAWQRAERAAGRAVDVVREEGTEMVRHATDAVREEVQGDSGDKAASGQTTPPTGGTSTAGRSGLAGMETGQRFPH